LNGLIAIGAKSATVTGPLGWLSDALATAVMVGVRSLQNGLGSLNWRNIGDLL